MPSTVDPGTCPVTPADVASEIGVGTRLDQRLTDATEAACQLVWMDLDSTDDTWPDPCPEPIRRAIIGCAVDLYRLPSTAFGYLIDDAGIASTGTDVLRRWRFLIDPYRTQWGFA